MKSNYIPVFSFILTALVLPACSGNKVDSSNAESTVAAPALVDEFKPQFVVDAAFQGQLAGLFNAYVALKDACVASDAAKVSAEASLATRKLGEVNVALPEGAARSDWEAYRASIGTALADMVSATDIEIQRKAFSNLSDALFKSVKAYGLGGTTAYYQFCPMAFNDEGAYWLSSEEKIRNPYFGDKMLSCGMTRETLK